jgi:predicted pyridoxine 5'-phosphate oxidase superfamily flavin-nucleotide-binding protein
MTAPVVTRLSLPGWPHEASPFHAGEVATQERAGVRERAERSGRRGIRGAMPDQHRAFFMQLPFLLVGSLDAQDRPWASALVGRPGFIDSPDAETLAIAARPAADDPLAAALAVGAPLGLLGIEPATRRRNRMNGTVIAVGERGFAVHVDQSFGNCPQYIQARTPGFVAANEPARPPRQEGALLSAEAQALIRRADTFFIASAAPGAHAGDPSSGVDVSHRGGRPGFVRVTAENGRTVLTAPDFAGNSFFNTLGNIAANPRAGLVFIDFAGGDVLQLTGRAEIVWDGPELAAFAGTQRLLRVTVDEGAWRAIPLRWSAPEPAPQLADTGAWEDVARTASSEHAAR